MKNYNCEYREGKELDIGDNWYKTIEANNPREAYEKFIKDVGVFQKPVIVDEGGFLKGPKLFVAHIETSVEKTYICYFTDKDGGRHLSGEIKLTSDTPINAAVSFVKQTEQREDYVIAEWDLSEFEIINVNELLQKDFSGNVKSVSSNTSQSTEQSQTVLKIEQTNNENNLNLIRESGAFAYSRQLISVCFTIGMVASFGIMLSGVYILVAKDDIPTEIGLATTFTGLIYIILYPYTRDLSHVPFDIVDLLLRSEKNKDNKNKPKE